MQTENAEECEIDAREIGKKEKVKRKRKVLRSLAQVPSVFLSRSLLVEAKEQGRPGGL